MILKSDLLKKARLEEICNIQHERVSVMMNKIRVRWQTWSDLALTPLFAGIRERDEIL